MDEDGLSIVLSPAQLAAVLSGASLRSKEPASFWTRAWGGGKLIIGVFEEVGAGALILTPEPTTLTKIGGGILGVHGADTVQSGARQLWTGRETPTLTQQGATATARAAGASRASAQAIGEGVDIAVPLVVSFGLGAARIAAVRSGRIVLAEHEALAGSRLGGHTIARHVGRTDAELLQRLVTKPSLDAASTFNNLSEAEAAVTDVLRVRRAEIVRWLKSATTTRPKSFSLPFPGGVGRVIVRGATTPVPGRLVKVALVKQAFRGKVYYVLTAFPQA